MQRQHLRGFLIHQRIELQMRRMIFQHAEDRRGEQHIAVVAQLNHQYSADAV